MAFKFSGREKKSTRKEPTREEIMYDLQNLPFAQFEELIKTLEKGEESDDPTTLFNNIQEEQRLSLPKSRTKFLELIKPLSGDAINRMLQNLPYGQLEYLLRDLKQGGMETDLKGLIKGFLEKEESSIIVDAIFHETQSVIDDILEEYLDEWLDTWENQSKDRPEIQEKAQTNGEEETQSDKQETNFFSSNKLTSILSTSIKDSALVPQTDRFKYLLSQPKFQKLYKESNQQTRSIRTSDFEKLEEILQDGKVLELTYDLLFNRIKDGLKAEYLGHILAISPPDPRATSDEYKSFFEYIFSELKENRHCFPEQLLKKLLRETSVFKLNRLFKHLEEKDIDIDSIKLLNYLLRERFSDLLEGIAESLKEEHEKITDKSPDYASTSIKHIMNPVWDQLGFVSKDIIMLKAIWGKNWQNIVALFLNDFRLVHFPKSNEEPEEESEILMDRDLKVILKNLQEIATENPLKDIENLDQVILNHEADAWRKIDGDWLKNAESLALKLDSDTNNTSLVLAIELIDSGKVLLFPGDAQAGNWISWKDVTFDEVPDEEGNPVTAQALLRNTVFYKVGHHGSHNATLKTAFPKKDSPPAEDVGLEVMAKESKDLVAMIPVEKTMAKNHEWKMPFPELYDRLLEKTGHRIIRADDGVVGTLDEKTEKKKLEDFWKAHPEHKKQWDGLKEDPERYWQDLMEGRDDWDELRSNPESHKKALARAQKKWRAFMKKAMTNHLALFWEVYPEEKKKWEEVRKKQEAYWKKNPEEKKQWEAFKKAVVDFESLPQDEKTGFEVEHFPGYFEYTISG